MQQYDIRAIGRLLAAKLLPLLISTLIGAVLLGSLAVFAMKKQYTSQVLMYVSNLENAEQTDSLSYLNIYSSARLVQTYIEVLEDPALLTAVAPQLSRTVTSGQLANMLTFSSIENTALLRISVTADDPTFAAEVAHVVSETAPQMLQKVVGAGSVKTVGSARQGAKTAPNEAKMTLIGALLGFTITAAIILIRYINDNTVKTEADIKQRLDVPVLGVIPRFARETAGGKKNGN